MKKEVKNLNLDVDLEQDEAKTGISRRQFLKGTGAMGIMGLGTALIGFAPRSSAEEETETEEAAEAGAEQLWSTTPDELVEFGASTMSLEELNERRRELIDSKGDYTCTDGTVIPAVWNKLRTLLDTYGWGIGTAKQDTAFDFLQLVFTEEEAEAYLTMPMGVLFASWEWAQETGRDADECDAMCEDLANRGLLWHARRSGMVQYHQVAVAHGIHEYNLDRYYETDWITKFYNVFNFGEDEGAKQNSGTPFYYAIPCDESVVADEEGIVLNDDWRKIIARHSVIGVSPCQCRMANMIRAGEEEQVPAVGSEELKDYISPLCGHPLETCLSFGEEAEYYIEKGIARQITQDEAVSILERSVEYGMVIQSCYTRDTEIICSCHGDCCGILKGYVAAGVEAAATCNAYPNTSNYDLVYDKDSCIKCGLCVDQCPMFAITMDDEGYPTVNELCVRCGQCGTVCPQSARKLTLNEKAADRFAAMPSNLLDDYNMQAKFRFEHGWIH
ncbi:MAG: 4Fe-4S binding protein [Lachnospiraceae bacterium]|nr:4Fe-4S binding protein [Lachnospiraceae bacterium]